jgi:predicted membrane protein DUF2157
MLPAYIEKLYIEQLITSEEYAALKKQHQQPVSLFTDLHVLLYAGILLLSTGTGILIYTNIDSIGHGVVVAIIALLCIACFIYCFKQSPGFSPLKQISINTLTDYILLLGCLLMLTLTAYLQYQYNLFGNHWALAVVVPMVLLFLSAYYFDHIGVLSLAITNLAAWAGLTVTPLNILKNNDFSNPHLFFTGIVLGTGLYFIAYVSARNNFKAHFGYTYRNFSIHLLYICLLAAMFYYEKTYFSWFLCIAGLTACICRFTLNIKWFYFFITAVLYCYIAVCYVIYNLVFLLGDEAGFYLYIIWFIISGIALIRAFIHYNKIIKRDAHVQQ